LDYLSTTAPWNKQKTLYRLMKSGFDVKVKICGRLKESIAEDSYRKIIKEYCLPNKSSRPQEQCPNCQTLSKLLEGYRRLARDLIYDRDIRPQVDETDSRNLQSGRSTLSPLKQG
jgi:hypothetical protein